MLKALFFVLLALFLLFPSDPVLGVLDSLEGEGEVSFVFNSTETVEELSRKDIEELVILVAGMYKVDPALVLKIVKAESNFNPEAVSPKGAMGLMQLMPLTAREWGVVDPFCPEDNVSGGVRYFRHLYLHLGSVDLALAAYNGGIGNVKKYGGIPPFPETVTYVEAILN